MINTPERELDSVSKKAATELFPNPIGIYYHIGMSEEHDILIKRRCYTGKLQLQEKGLHFGSLLIRLV